MRESIMGLVALIGWIALMVGIVVSFLIGVTAVTKTAIVIGSGMFAASVLYANTEGEDNGRANR